MTTRTHELLAAARTRPLTDAERAELDPRHGAQLDPLSLAEALAGGAQRLSPEEAERVFRGSDREVTSVIEDPMELAEAIAGGAARLSPEEAARICPSPGADAGETLQVVVLREGVLVTSQSFEPGEYAVGSDSGSELCLDDPSIGRCHAFLVFRDGTATLQVVSAGAEMLVNGLPQRTAEVRALDDVVLGPFLLKLRVASPRKQRAPAPAPHAAADPARRPAAPAPAATPARPGPRPVPAPAAARAAPVAPAARPAPRPIPAPAAAHAAPVAPATPDPARRPAATAHAPAPRPAASAPSGRVSLRMAPSPSAARRPSPADHDLEPEGKPGKDPGPVLRVRVYWGKANVGLYGFEPGRAVYAGPSETADVAAYRLPLPSDRFLLARSDRAGRWTLRVPHELRAFSFEREGWRPALGVAEGEVTNVALEPGKLVRLGDAAYSVEVRVERVRRAGRAGLRDLARSGVALPAGLIGVLGAAVALGVVYMPHYDKDAQDFTPQQMLRAAKAVLKPPEKKKEEKKAEKKEEKPKEKEKPSDQKVELPPDVPRTKSVQQVNRALKSVEKITSGLAVESLLKATSKLTGGPKGYGDKGMGYKLSPLTGKPPVAMAGMGFGPGLGGFGTETKGLGAIRGMGGGGSGGIGAFSAGGVGKGKVGGTVVASAAGFKQRGGGGTLARELIAKVINDHLGEVRGCYERALLREAGLAGKLNLEWTIGTDGRVEEVKVKQATIKGSEVPNCIVGSLKTWIFPKPTGGKVIVSYPFLFNSVGF